MSSEQVRIRTKRAVAGFVLLEMIIVIVIVGILAAVAWPNYAKSIEQNKGKSAEINLIAIYNAQKRYKMDNDAYYVCDPNCVQNGVNMINQALNVNINDANFNYTIQSDGVSGYSAVAIRLGGSVCNGMTINITNASSSVNKGCNAW